MSQKTVGLAMSGGIDSSVSAHLLRENGYDVIGFNFTIQKDPERSKHQAERINAITSKIGIQHFQVDLSSLFKKEVIEPFRDAYLNGLTPNPCAMCNRKIKWGALRKAAFEFGCELFATGHYARIEKRDEYYILKKGTDTKKDQSYFLYFLSQDDLSKTIFPLGNMKKDDIRELALKIGLPLDLSKESQDLCFVTSGELTNEIFKNQSRGSGNILNTDGKVIGKHKGLEFYTVGQRKGIDIAFTEPLFVIDKDADNNNLIVGVEKELFQDSMTVTSFTSAHPLCPNAGDNPFDCGVKIRYRSQTHKASILRVNDSDIEVEFFESVKGVAPGQVAVFYIEDEVLGGGIIKR